MKTIEECFCEGFWSAWDKGPVGMFLCWMLTGKSPSQHLKDLTGGST